VGQEPYLLSSSLAFVVGLLVVFLIERLAYRSGLDPEQGA